MAALEVLTDEGVHALGVAASTGPRLVVEYACVGKKSDLHDGEGHQVPESAELYAKLTASDIASWASSERMPCVAMLPSTVVFDESTEAGREAAQLEPRDAIDIEFSWLPVGDIEFDTVVVLARLYYGYTEYLPGLYTRGRLVWYREGSTVKYYNCIADVTVDSVVYGPASDTEHWEEVELTDRVIGSDPPLRAVTGSRSLILLHISTTDQMIRVGQGLELDYKLRIFLNRASFDMSDKETCPVYLESLVPAGNAALQLGFLKEMSQSMAAMRDIIAEAYK